MGAALQTAGAAELAAELTCCACSSVCGLITRNAATRAKFRYWSLLFMATATCIVLLIPGLRAKINKIPHFCDKVISSDTCDKLIGFSAVYRILFSLTVFHFLLAIFTIRVDRVKSVRAKFNNGLWLIKMGMITGITYGSFYIPKQTGFFRIWMYISLTGGFVFAMFQIILVIDFGHSWSLSWAERLDAGYTKFWYLAMTIVTAILFAMSIGAACSFYLFFTHPPDVMKCHANVFYISFITIQCFVASIVSMTPSVQHELGGAGLLQSSVVILYTMYLTFNTLTAEPDSLCNPLGSIIVEYDSFTGVSGQTIFGSMVTLSLLVFACTVRTSTSHLGKYGLALAESEEFAMSAYRDDRQKENVEKHLESGGKEIFLDEYVGYNYSFFHIIMSLASLHILMVITNWHSPDENSSLKKLVKNWASVWVQMATSFLCILVYIWFLVTPLVKKVWGPIFGIFANEKTDLNRKRQIKPKLRASINDSLERKSVKEFNFTDNSNKDSHVSKTNIQSNQAAPSVEQLNNIDRLENISKSRQPLNLKAAHIRKKEVETSFISDHGSSKVMPSYISGSIRPPRKEICEIRYTNNMKSSPPSPDNSRLSYASSYRRREGFNRRRANGSDCCRSNNSIASAVSSRVSNNNNEQRYACRYRVTPQARIDAKEKRKMSIDSFSESNLHKGRIFSNNVLNASKLQAIDKKRDFKIRENDKKIADKIERLTKEKEQPIRERYEKKRRSVNDNYSDVNISRRVDVLEDANKSLVSTVFTNKPQNPVIAKEILRVQWKILRYQAKLVKIQEQIIRLQDEAARENGDAQLSKSHHGNSAIYNSRKSFSSRKELG